MFQLGQSRSRGCRAAVCIRFPSEERARSEDPIRRTGEVSTSRSMMLRNWRTLPGQGKPWRARTAPLLRCLPCRLYLAAKWAEEISTKGEYLQDDP